MFVSFLDSIYRIIFVFIFICFVILSSLFLVFYLKSDNLPFNSYISKLIAIKYGNTGIRVTADKVEVLSFRKIKPIGFDVKFTNLKVFDKNNKNDNNFLLIKDAIVHVSLLSIFLGKPFVSDIDITEVIFYTNNNNIYYEKEFVHLYIKDFLQNAIEFGNNINKFFIKFFEYIKSADDFNVIINKFSFFKNELDITEIKVASFFEKHDIKRIWIRFFVDDVSEFHGGISFDRHGIKEMSFADKNFNSNAYNKIFNFNPSTNNFYADNILFVFKYRDYLDGLESININVSNAKGQLDIFNWNESGYKFINSNLSVDILNNGAISINDANFLVQNNVIGIKGIIDIDNDDILLEIISDNVDFKSFYYHFPSSGVDGLKNWMQNNIKYGVAETVRILLDSDLHDLLCSYGDDFLEILNLGISFNKANLVVQDEDGDLNIKNIKGIYVLSNMESIIGIDSSIIDGVVFNGVVYSDFYNNKSNLELSLSFNGNVGDSGCLLLKQTHNYDLNYCDILKKSFGIANGALYVSIPLENKNKNTTFELNANFSNIIIQKFLDPLDLMGANVVINSSNTRTFVDGKGYIAGGVSEFNFFYDNVKNKNKLKISIDADAQDVSKISSIGEIINNIVNIDGDLHIDIESNNISKKSYIVDASVDLKNTNMNFLDLNISKPLKSSASITANVEINKNNILINSVKYLSKEITMNVVNGKISKVSPEYEISITADKSDLYDFNFLISKSNGGQKKIVLLADLFDGRSKYLTRSRGNDNNVGNIDLTVKINKIIMHNSIIGKSMSLESKCGFYRCDWFVFDLLFGDVDRVDAGYDGERLCAKTTNFALLSEAIGFSDFVTKGNAMMCINSFADKDGNISGKIASNGINIKKGGVLSEALSSDKSFEDIDKKIKKLDKKVLEFERMHSKFFYNKNGIILFKNGVLYSPMLGITFNGDFNLVSGAININGSILPIYGINSIIAQFPLFGDIISGGRGGILGIDYSITGDMKKPFLKVNPLSVFVPGIIRNIFDSSKKSAQITD